MIQADLFVSSSGQLRGFHISGHAGMAESGKDVLCAFISSAAYMAANTITEVIHADAEVSAEDGDMYVMVDPKDAALCRDILEGLKLHLINTEEQYPEFLKVNYLESYLEV